MKTRCRIVGLILVTLALVQSLSVAVAAWQAGHWPTRPSDWVALALLPLALWVGWRYFSPWGRCECADDDVPR